MAWLRSRRGGEDDDTGEGRGGRRGVVKLVQDEILVSVWGQNLECVLGGGDWLCKLHGTYFGILAFKDLYFKSENIYEKGKM